MNKFLFYILSFILFIGLIFSVYAIVLNVTKTTTDNNTTPIELEDNNKKTSDIGDYFKNLYKKQLETQIDFNADREDKTSDSIEDDANIEIDLNIVEEEPEPENNSSGGGGGGGGSGSSSEDPTPTPDPEPTPDPDPTPEITYENPFYDDFSMYTVNTCFDNNTVYGDWIFLSNGGGCNQFTDNNFNYWYKAYPGWASSLDESYYNMILGPDYNSDLNFEVKLITRNQVRQNDDPANSEVAQIFWYIDENIERYYYFIPEPIGWELGKIDPDENYDNNVRILATGTDYNFPIDNWYDIKVEQLDNNIAVYVDNNLIVEFSDNERAYTNGRIGLHSKDAYSKFDEIKINFNFEDANYTKMLEKEIEYILNCQVDSGAIALTPDSPHLNPYYANLSLIRIYDTDYNHDTEIKEYLEWYLSKYNQTPDDLNTIGTIYDFYIDNNGDEVPTYTIDPTAKNYDSSDAYAGTYLSLIKAYYDNSNDLNFINSNLSHFKLIAGAIDATLQDDNLTWAKPDYHTKYLMDNLEAWKGYKDFADLLIELGDINANDYNQIANDVQNAIETLLWNEDGQEYDPYLGHDNNWDKFYPDAAANMWPTLFDLPEAENRKEALYDELFNNNPEWLTLEANDSPWTAISAVSADLNREHVYTYIENMNYKFFERAWPWKNNQSGWLIKTYSILEN
jgi:hypothetical protein